VLAEDEVEGMNGTKANGNGAENMEEGKEETVRAKFMVGCDGARSWVRKWVFRIPFFQLPSP
jgi:2-polyprenyl-6-methoxyphenol hydroxylase-like FAD-dependent oxidoreductase